MSLYYYLNEDHTYRPCSCGEWSEQHKTMDNHVADDFVNGAHVSTVWLGIDHNHLQGERPDAKPILFETMVFDHGKDFEYLTRYSTWEEAVGGHKKAIQWVLDGCKEDD